MKLPIAATIFYALSSYSLAVFIEKARISPIAFKKAMLANGIPKWQIPTWQLIVKQATDYDMAHWSKYTHGIFNISQKWWCGKDKGCKLSCALLRDRYIKDDIECAKLIYARHKRKNRSGFDAWAPFNKRNDRKKFIFF